MRLNFNKRAEAIAKDYGITVVFPDMTDPEAVKFWAKQNDIKPLADVEYRTVMLALYRAGYNKTLAAKALGISYQQLRNRLIKWGKDAWEG
jgi:transcriptional regulator with AAA-type ATPase domain